MSEGHGKGRQCWIGAFLEDCREDHGCGEIVESKGVVGAYGGWGNEDDVVLCIRSEEEVPKVEKRQIPREHSTN